MYKYKEPQLQEIEMRKIVKLSKIAMEFAAESCLVGVLMGVLVYIGGTNAEAVVETIFVTSGLAFVSGGALALLCEVGLPIRPARAKA